MRRWTSWLGAIAAATLIGGCGGGGDELPTAPVGVQRDVVSVRVEPDAVLFNRSGETRSLRARAFDAQGAEIDGLAVTWSSSNAAAIAVDVNGQARADSARGSSQLTANISGVRSAPLLAVVSAMPPGTVVLGDADLNGDPRESAANGPRGTPGNTMEFTLSAGVASPAVGALVVGNGGKPIAGRVSAVDATGGPAIVRLTPASMRELFPNLSINEVIDMSRAEVRINPEIAARYDVTRVGNRHDFKPKPGAVFSNTAGRAHALAAAIGTRAILPPFTDCKTTITGLGESGPNPIALSVPPLFSVEIAPTLEIVNTPERGLERLVVRAQPSFNIEAGLGVALAFEGSYECKVVLYEIFVPVAGALSVIAGGIVPVGVGFEIGGNFTLANFEIKSKVGSKADAALGIACTAAAGCGVVHELGNFQNTFEPTVTTPSLEGDNVRVEAGLELFGFVDVEFGNRLFERFRLEALEAKVGGAFKGEFAPQRAQLADTEFKANYGVKIAASVEAGSELEGLAAHFGLDSLTFLSLQIELPLAESPQGTVTADRAQVIAGDLVRFDVTLDPVKVNFIPGVGPYNVDAVVLVRRLGDGSTQEMARQAAADEQTSFRFEFNAPAAGNAGDYHAFVLTRLLSLDPHLLELGRATAPAPAGVTGTSSRGLAVVNLGLGPLTCDPGGDLGIREQQNVQSPPGATAWSDRVSCERTAPQFNSLSGVASASFTETRAGENLVAVRASGSGSVSNAGGPFVSGRLLCSQASYFLDFDVRLTADVLINAQLVGGSRTFLELFRTGAASALIRVGPGIGSVNQTVTLAPGRYNIEILAQGCATAEALPSSGAFNFSLNLTFQ